MVLKIQARAIVLCIGKNVDNNETSKISREHCTKNEVFHYQGPLQQIWQNLQFPTDLFAFTEEILNGKLHFCAVEI